MRQVTPGEFKSGGTALTWVYSECNTTTKDLGGGNFDSSIQQHVTGVDIHTDMVNATSGANYSIHGTHGLLHHKWSYNFSSLNYRTTCWTRTNVHVNSTGGSDLTT